MGLISRLKKLFNKNIECGDELEGHFIYLYPNSKRIVHINSHILVGDNHYAVFVCNDRVCDILVSGKHRITGATLPKTFSKLHLDKPNKKGKLPKTFKADIYYIYKSVMEKQPFCSQDRFKKKSNHFGKVKGYSEGVCDLQVFDPETLMKNLLFGKYYLKNKVGLTLTQGLIGNVVNRIIEDCDLRFTRILLKPSILNDLLNPAVNEKVEKYGIRANNVELTSFKLSKSMQRKVTEYLSEKSMYEAEFSRSGIKYVPEQVVPGKIDINNTPEHSQDLSQDGPDIIRRGGLTNAPINHDAEYTTNIGANDVFSQENKKVCKFCGKTIDSHYLFCPHCGFKQ